MRHPIFALTSSLALALALTGLGAPGQAHPTGEKDSEKSTKEEPAERRVHHFLVHTGFRGNVIADAGYDPYDADDYLPQASIGATVLPWSFGAVHLGVGVQYDFGSAAAEARGVPASVMLHRLSLGAHAQLELWERLQLYTRFSPGVVNASASLEESIPLGASGWTWSVEANLGTALRLGSAGPSQQVRFWLVAEAGYVFAGRAEMIFGPDLEDDDPRTVGNIQLPDVKPQGFTHRLAFAFSF